MKAYKPKGTDINRLKPKPDMLKVSGDGVFATLQGEGVTAGKKAVFLRLHYCNLTCGKPTGWQCDTRYTWDVTDKRYWTEPEDWTYSDTAQKINRAWEEKFKDDKNKRLVITGGEPLLQQQKLSELLRLLPDWDIEIETNGTIAPIEKLHNCQINCSPKLANSGNELTKRYKPKVLKAINTLPDSWFKFVVTKPTDLSEVEKIINDCNLNEKKVLIMPEGRTAEEVECHASLVKEEVENRGWNIALRNQLIWYGSKRRT